MNFNHQRNAGLSEKGSDENIFVLSLMESSQKTFLMKTTLMVYENIFVLKHLKFSTSPSSWWFPLKHISQIETTT